MPAPFVNIPIQDDSIYAETTPNSIPLFILATRANKTLPTGTGVAAGTAESEVLRLVTSQREVLQLLGNPTFVTSGGAVVQGHEANEYGLHALWSYMGTASQAYYVRADFDMNGILPTTTEPLGPPADGLYWVDSDAVVGGVYRRNAADNAWELQNFEVYLSAPGGGDGADGDVAMDYSTNAGTFKIKNTAGTWVTVGSTDLTATSIDSRLATTDDFWISDTAPTGAGANDYWLKTGTSGGVDLMLTVYSASDDTFQSVSPTHSVTAPTSPATGDVWHDLSAVGTDGTHPIKYWDGAAWQTLAFGTTANTLAVQAAEPTTDPSDGDLWYDATTDFAMYQESSDAWVEITTTTVANPSATQKVISASAPTSPSTGALWIDLSGANADSYPIVKRWNGTAWEEITDSVLVDDTFRTPSTVLNGTYWINTGDPGTTNIVKQWDDTYEAPIVNGAGTALETFALATNRRWKPITGSTFGRRSQRSAVVTALQAAIASNEEIRSEAFYYQLIAAPGYSELYDDMITLNTDIGETAFIVSDVPSRMIASGVPTGKEITATTWKNNLNVASTMGEDGFTASGYAYAAMWYPWGLSTNVDGLDVMVPSSTIALRTLAYNDQIAYPWFAPMGLRRGQVRNAASVGYLNDDGDYTAVNLSQGQGDTLYDLDINPIMYFSGAGLRVWGQRTLYGISSSLDRINVARLIVKMRWDLRQVLRAFIGEPNDPITWNSVRNLVQRYLTGLISLRAIYDAAVRVDEENNTPARIDANELWVDIAIKPVKAIEFIYVPIRLVATGDPLDFA